MVPFLTGLLDDFAVLLHASPTIYITLTKNNHLSTKLISIIFNVHVPIYNVVYNQNYVYLHLIKK